MKKFGKRIVGLVAVMALVSCAFVGATFAKYTSSKDASATTNVALWKIDGISENGTVNDYTVTVNDAKPGDAKDTTTYTITNSSEVAAEITFAQKAENGYTITTVGNVGLTEYDDSVTLTEAMVKDTIVLTYTVKVGEGAEQVIYSTANDVQASVNNKFDLAVGASAVITVTYEWKTQDDATDTAIGMTVESIAQAFTLTATQKIVTA